MDSSLQPIMSNQPEGCTLIWRTLCSTLEVPLPQVQDQEQQLWQSGGQSLSHHQCHAQHVDWPRRAIYEWSTHQWSTGQRYGGGCSKLATDCWSERGEIWLWSNPWCGRAGLFFCFFHFSFLKKLVLIQTRAIAWLTPARHMWVWLKIGHPKNLMGHNHIPHQTTIVWVRYPFFSTRALAKQLADQEYVVGCWSNLVYVQQVVHALGKTICTVWYPEMTRMKGPPPMHIKTLLKTYSWVEMFHIIVTMGQASFLKDGIILWGQSHFVAD